MDAALITIEGARVTADEASIRQLLEAGTPFWLDLFGGDADTTHLLRDVFQFHPLAGEDAEHFGQRPKIDDYEDYALIVMYGVAKNVPNALVETHSFYSEHYLVTVHHDPCPDLDRLKDKLHQTAHWQPLPIILLPAVVDSLVDSFFPALADFDDDIDD